MKKGVKIFLIIFLSLIIITGIIVPLLPFMFGWSPTYGEPVLEFPFENQYDIIRLRPYGLIESVGDSDHHTGIDLQIENASKVISPCTGTVALITSTVHETKGHIMISINIIINLGWSVMLVFEPYSNDTDFHQLQLENILIKFGDKVEIGDEIGTLLNGGEFPHIHFTVNRLLKDVCPYNYSSQEAQEIYNEIALRTNSTICV